MALGSVGGYPVCIDYHVESISVTCISLHLTLRVVNVFLGPLLIGHAAIKSRCGASGGPKTHASRHGPRVLKKRLFTFLIPYPAVSPPPSCSSVTRQNPSLSRKTENKKQYKANPVQNPPPVVETSCHPSLGVKTLRKFWLSNTDDPNNSRVQRKKGTPNLKGRPNNGTALFLRNSNPRSRTSPSAASPGSAGRSACPRTTPA